MDWSEYHLKHCSLFITLSLEVMGTNYIRNFSHLNLRKFIFSERVIDDWNHLPTFLIESSNVLIFKTKLDIFWNCNRFDYS